MKQNLLNDLVAAMKSQDKETLSVLRMVKGAIQLEEINKKSELSDEDFIGVVSKQIKTRKESITEFEKAMHLAKKCDEKLKNAEESITKIVSEDGTLENFKEEI